MCVLIIVSCILTCFLSKSEVAPEKMEETTTTIDKFNEEEMEGLEKNESLIDTLAGWATQAYEWAGVADSWLQSFSYFCSDRVCPPGITEILLPTKLEGEGKNPRLRTAREILTN